MFNGGERVEGYTSPLWLALLIPLFAVREEPSALALALGASIGFASIWLIAAAGRLSTRWSSQRNRRCALEPVWDWKLVVTAFCLLVTFVLLMDGKITPLRLFGAGTALSLAVLSRPDCVWLVPLALIRIVVLSRPWFPRAASHAAVFLAPFTIVAVHAVWRHAYYGEWLPNTYYAKAGVDGSVLLGHGLEYMRIAALSLLPLTVMVLLPPSPYRRAISIGLIWWAVLVVMVGGDHFPYFRFLTPLLPVLAYGMGSITAHVPGQWSVPVKSALVVAAVLLVNGVSLLDSSRTRGPTEVFLADSWTDVGR